MNPHVLAFVIPLSTQLVVALAMLAVPHLTPRDLLFGIPVPEGFRSTQTGRHALRSYRLLIAIPALLSVLVILLFPSPQVFVASLLAMVVVGVAAFVTQNQKLKPLAIQPPLVRQTMLGPPESLPWFTWLGIPPLALLAGAAVYLHSHWEQIPAHYPVHFGLDGTPNRWANRTVRGVYGPLVLGGEFTLFLFVMALSIWYGSRRSDSMRRPIVAVTLAAEWIIALLPGAIALKLASGIAIPTALMALGPLVLLIPAMAYAVHESNKPRDPIDPTPNECWKGGIIYYNPNDAALFVQRRDSIGFTFNMANRWSWAIFGGLLLVLASMPLLLGL